MLPHDRPHLLLGCWHRRHDEHAECRRPLLRYSAPCYRDLQRTESSTVVGDNAGCGSTKQEGCSHHYCELSQPILSLVLAVLDPDVAGAFLSVRRRLDSVRLPLHRAPMLGHEVVGEAVEQETPRNRGVQRAQRC